MHKRLSLLLAVVTASAVLGLGSPARSAELPASPSLADLATTVTGEPLEVSPVGGSVYYTVTFRNNGPLDVDAKLTDQTTGGGTFLASQSDVDPRCKAPKDLTVDPVISCELMLASGQQLVIVVAIRTPAPTPAPTPAAPIFVENTSTAAVNPNLLDPVIDINSTNDSDSVSTPVFNNPAGSSGSVAKGDSISFKDANVDATVTVTEADKPITIYLAGAAPENDICGTGPCDPGLNLDFGKDPDRQGMLRVDVTFTSEPCFGVGSDKCKAVYERKNNGETNETIRLVPDCSTLPFGSKTTCRLEGKPSKDGRYIRHSFRMFSEDPGLLPVGSLDI